MNKEFITSKAMEAVTFNEVGGNPELVYRFSDPDGVRNGKSGWSFGRVQFDTRNNWQAILCLQECGFTVAEAVMVIEQSGDISHLNAKLRAHGDVIDYHDRLHISHSVEHCIRVIEDNGGIRLENDSVMVHIVDYHNQFYLTPGGALHEWLQAQERPIVPKDILDFKIEHTLWGRKRPDDVKRRWRNIERIMKG